jgi:hypothetical protein
MRDAQGLRSLMAVTSQPNNYITANDLQHSMDARSGLANATISQNRFIPTNAVVMITFSDGVTWLTGMINMIAFGGPSEWRMEIGSGWSAPAP